jgi:drug/metabolite transporter (DMT)-like permease
LADQNQILKKDLRLLLAFVAIYIIWGTTYLAIKIGIEFIPPYLMAALRYLLAGALLLVYCLSRGESIFATNIKQNILLGAFIMTFGQATAFWAEKYISSGLTAVFGSLMPVCYIITDRRHWKNYAASKWTILSIGLGLVGILILFIRPAAASESTTGFITVLASATTVSGCFCWAAGSLYHKYHVRGGSLYANVGWQLIGGLICCLIISGIAGEWPDFDFGLVPWRAWAAVLYLAIAGSIVALIALYWLLARRPAAIVGTYAYVNPVIAVLLGYFIADEKITLIQILGMIIIIAAAFIANLVKFTTEYK